MNAMHVLTQSGLRRLAVVALLFMSALGTAGCRVDGFFQGDDEEGAIEHDIVFSLAERQWSTTGAPEPPRLFLTMQTKEIFPCVNYQIRHSVSRDGNVIRMRALEVILPGQVCLTALGPAQADIELDLEEGSYELLLINGDVQDGYGVTVTHEYVRIEPVQSQWSEPTATLFWRFPPDSFTFTCGTLVETASLCTDFAAVLEALPLTPIGVPEEGVWPYGLRSSGHWYDAPSRFYTYPDAATWEQVKALLRDFTLQRLKDQQGVGLTVSNWMGDREMSWMVLRGN